MNLSAWGVILVRNALECMQHKRKKEKAWAADDLMMGTHGGAWRTNDCFQAIHIDYSFWWLYGVLWFSPGPFLSLSTERNVNSRIQDFPQQDRGNFETDALCLFCQSSMCLWVPCLLETTNTTQNKYQVSQSSVEKYWGENNHFSRITLGQFF